MPHDQRNRTVVQGVASLHLVDGVSLLRPEDRVFSAMLAGFTNQLMGYLLETTGRPMEACFTHGCRFRFVECCVKRHESESGKRLR